MQVTGIESVVVLPVAFPVLLFAMHIQLLQTLDVCGQGHAIPYVLSRYHMSVHGNLSNIVAYDHPFVSVLVYVHRWPAGLRSCTKCKVTSVCAIFIACEAAMPISFWRDKN